MRYTLTSPFLSPIEKEDNDDDGEEEDQSITNLYLYLRQSLSCYAFSYKFCRNSRMVCWESNDERDKFEALKSEDICFVGQANVTLQ